MLNLLQGNKIQIESGFQKTKPIQVQKGVAQGSPLSPGLFNLALDDTLKELADPNVREVFGFSLHPDLEKVSVLAFADDIALISKDEASLQTLINMNVFNLDAIDPKVNPQKCKYIILRMVF